MALFMEDEALPLASLGDVYDLSVTQTLLYARGEGQTGVIGVYTHEHALVHVDRVLSLELCVMHLHSCYHYSTHLCL